MTGLLIAGWFVCAFAALAFCAGWRKAAWVFGEFAGLLLWPIGLALCFAKRTGR